MAKRATSEPKCEKLPGLFCTFAQPLAAQLLIIMVLGIGDVIQS